MSAGRRAPEKDQGHWWRLAEWQAQRCKYWEVADGGAIYRGTPLLIASAFVCLFFFFFFSELEVRSSMENEGGKEVFKIEETGPK